MSKVEIGSKELDHYKKCELELINTLVQLTEGTKDA